jgi:hypothetical protein
VSVGGDFIYRVVVARVSGLPADAECEWGVRGAGGSSHSEAKKDGKELAAMQTALVGVPKDLATSSVQVLVAIGPWETVGTDDGRSQGGVSTNKGLCYIFGEAIAARKGTVLTLAHNIDGREARVVAVDRDGRERAPTRAPATGVKDFCLIGAEFDLRPEAIKEYRLQTRGFQHVEIPGIALNPRGAR